MFDDPDECGNCKTNAGVFKLQIWDTQTSGSALWLCEACLDDLHDDDDRFCAFGPGCPDGSFERANAWVPTARGRRRITLCDVHWNKVAQSHARTPRPPRGPPSPFEEDERGGVER